MATSNHKQIYNIIVSLLDYNTMTRGELIEEAVTRLKKRTVCDITDKSCIGTLTALRGKVGAVISEMEDSGLIKYGKGGYYLVSSKPVILRAEACEREILRLLRKAPSDKSAIRRSLEEHFGTKATISAKDDNILATLIGQQLKRLTALGIIKLNEDDGLYSVAEASAVRLDDIDAMLVLKEEFLTRLHSRGGEFFEHFFMTLLGKYLSKHGKTVIDNRVNGGSFDGGIDGIIETEDSLGFRERTMVQMKNRLEDTNETTVRGFYGSVCAYQGTRGIFATTSDFHSSALTFLDGIDNCVGVSGSKIFSMACECQYGIRRRHGKYTIDTKIL